MEIKTKFNVGDKVYRLKYTLMETENRVYRWTCVLDTINSIYTRTEKFTKIIYYFNYGSLGGVNVLEKDCFKTREQAQKECDRRNGKIY